MDKNKQIIAAGIKSGSIATKNHLLGQMFGLLTAIENRDKFIEAFGDHVDFQR